MMVFLAVLLFFLRTSKFRHSITKRFRQILTRVSLLHKQRRSSRSEESTELKITFADKN